MQIIKHRCNTITALTTTHRSFGVEIDIRSFGDELILHHDPFVPGESFKTWLQSFAHKTLILNVKEEGLENRIIELMHHYSIEDFFFLDQSFPFLIKTIQQHERRCAIRLSEYESIDTVLSLAGDIDWVWVDYFSYFPLDTSAAHTLLDAGFKLCIVSPELQGYPADIHIPLLRNLLNNIHVSIDAVCTKEPQLWL